MESNHFASTYKIAWPWAMGTMIFPHSDWDFDLSSAIYCPRVITQSLTTTDFGQVKVTSVNTKKSSCTLRAKKGYWLILWMIIVAWYALVLSHNRSHSLDAPIAVPNPNVELRLFLGCGAAHPSWHTCQRWMCQRKVSGYGEEEVARVRIRQISRHRCCWSDSGTSCWSSFPWAAHELKGVVTLPASLVSSFFSRIVQAVACFVYLHLGFLSSYKKTTPPRRYSWSNKRKNTLRWINYSHPERACVGIDEAIQLCCASKLNMCLESRKWLTWPSCRLTIVQLSSWQPSYPLVFTSWKVHQAVRNSPYPACNFCWDCYSMRCKFTISRFYCTVLAVSNWPEPDVTSYAVLKYVEVEFLCGMCRSHTWASCSVQRFHVKVIHFGARMHKKRRPEEGACERQLKFGCLRGSRWFLSLEIMDILLLENSLDHGVWDTKFLTYR